LFTDRLRRFLKPRHRFMQLTGKNNLDWGHVCGTIRFGTDPRTSVLDRNNRTHDLTNLYVVDASFFPSSGGTNLSLTIAANALRSADSIAAQLEQSETSGRIRETSDLVAG
jgi:choline dehydrogenase-like flavoprotein